MHVFIVEFPFDKNSIEVGSHMGLGQVGKDRQNLNLHGLNASYIEHAVHIHTIECLNWYQSIYI